MAPQEFAPGIFLLPGSLPATVGEGALTINRFLVRGHSRRMLVDTGAPAQAEETLALVSEVIGLDELDYIFLSHLDLDHSGAVKLLLAKAPRVRLIGGMGNLAGGTLFHGLPAERMAVLWPGESIDLGGRRLSVEEPLLQDIGTLWLHDGETATLFPVDAFGALLQSPQAGALPGTEAYAQGFALWHAFNFPSLPMFDRARFAEAVKVLRQRALRFIAPVHGPLLSGDSLEAALELLARQLDAPPLEAVPLPPALRLTGGTP
jgi:flavorubredoxin